MEVTHLSPVSPVMACLPLYWSAFLLIAATCGQQTENITTTTKLSVIEEGNVTAQFTPQVGNVSTDVKDPIGAKTLLATDLPVEDPQVAAKQIKDQGHKTPFIAEPDAIKKGKTTVNSNFVSQPKWLINMYSIS